MSQTTPLKVVWCVMAAHNRRDQTLTCIKSILDQRLSTDLEVQILLVDDGSTDGTSQAVRACYPGVVIVTGDGSLFWGGAMRKGIAAAIERGAECLWLVNDDVQFTRNALDIMTAPLRLDASEAVHARPWVVGATCNAEGRTSYGGWRRSGRIWPRVEMLDPVGRAIPCCSANFNSVLLWADQYQTLGGLDSDFVHNAGDNDLSYRATRSGIPLLLAPTYVGKCDTNPPPLWRDSRVPLGERLRDLHSVKQYPPRQSIKFNLRHAGVAGVVYFLHPYLSIARSLISGRIVQRQD